jgi:hypothetical protein
LRRQGAHQRRTPLPQASNEGREAVPQPRRQEQLKNDPAVLLADAALVRIKAMGAARRAGESKDGMAITEADAARILHEEFGDSGALRLEVGADAPVSQSDGT